jgi:hypothetical protein
MKLGASFPLAVLLLPVLLRAIQTPSAPSPADTQVLWEFDTGG